MSNLGLFAKCNLFSMLPIEELALGLRPNSRLHQILHFLHVQLFGFANSNRSKNHQLNWARAQFFQTSCVRKTFKRGFIFTPPRVNRTNPLFRFAPSCAVFNQRWWASFITLAVAHESMILGLSPICINGSNTHRFHSILQCASRVKIGAARVLVRPTFFQPNSSNQLLSTFSCPICSQHFN